MTICPNYLSALEGAAQIEVSNHRVEAIPLLDRVLAVQPQNITAHAMPATLLRGQGRCSQAVSHYSASRALFSSRPDLEQGYGACLTDMGDLNAALPLCQQLLASDPNDTVRYDVALLQWKTHSRQASRIARPGLPGCP